MHYKEARILFGAQVLLSIFGSLSATLPGEVDIKIISVRSIIIHSAKISSLLLLLIKIVFRRTAGYLDYTCGHVTSVNGDSHFSTTHVVMYLCHN